MTALPRMNPFEALHPSAVYCQAGFCKQTFQWLALEQHLCPQICALRRLSWVSVQVVTSVCIILSGTRNLDPGRLEGAGKD